MLPVADKQVLYGGSQPRFENFYRSAGFLADVAQAKAELKRADTELALKLFLQYDCCRSQRLHQMSEQLVSLSTRLLREIPDSGLDEDNAEEYALAFQLLNNSTDAFFKALPLYQLLDVLVEMAWLRKTLVGGLQVSVFSDIERLLGMGLERPSYPVILRGNGENPRWHLAAPGEKHSVTLCGVGIAASGSENHSTGPTAHLRVICAKCLQMLRDGLPTVREQESMFDTFQRYHALVHQQLLETMLSWLASYSPTEEEAFFRTHRQQTWQLLSKEMSKSLQSQHGWPLKQAQAAILERVFTSESSELPKTII